VDKFESLLQKATEQNDTALLEQAVSLYTGDYLDEEGWLWAEPKKVSLHRKYQSALERVKEIQILNKILREKMK
jgi:two-component SAPR family response regulator